MCNVIDSYRHILDLVLTNKAVSEVSVVEAVCELVSDEVHHLPVDVSIGLPNLNLKYPKLTNCIPKPNIRNFRKALTTLHENIKHRFEAPLSNETYQ